jgi:hypothetical protein
MNRRTALFTALALFAIVPAAQAGGRPIPMQEIIDTPVIWPGATEGKLEQVQKAVFAGLAAKGWTATLAAPGKVHAFIQKSDWRCEIDVTFNTRTYSITYSNSEHLDYDPKKKVIHRNFNRWLLLLQQQINSALALQAG